MSKEYVRPAQEQWQKVLDNNRQLIKEYPFYSDIVSLREVLIQRAREYSETVLKEPVAVSEIPSTIVMSGHQPVLDHMGILYKKELLSTFSLASDACGLHMIIDTDTSCNGTWYSPQVTGEGFKRQKFSLSNQKTLYMFDVVEGVAGATASKDEYPEKHNAFVSSLPQGVPLVDFVTTHRRNFQKQTGNQQTSFLEVPLSHILNNTYVRSFITRVFLHEAERLHTAYNSVLDSFRKERGIKNKANPFPNLKADAVGFELPFWVVDTRKKQRVPLYVKEGAYIADGAVYLAIEDFPRYLFLAPRAMFTTLLFRLYLSDFFIHGLGGEHYDVCTNKFIEEYIGVTPPEFVVVSKTEELYPEEAKEIRNMEQLLSIKREIAFHPENFLKQGLFNEGQVSKLQELAVLKSRLIEQLKAKKKSKKSAANETQEIKKIEKAVFALIEEAFLTAFPKYYNLSEEQRQVYTSREYPYFLF